jgi:hypothetical protein
MGHVQAADLVHTNNSIDSMHATCIIDPAYASLGSVVPKGTYSTVSTVVATQTALTRLA